MDAENMNCVGLKYFQGHHLTRSESLVQVNLHTYIFTLYVFLNVTLLASLYLLKCIESRSPRCLSRLKKKSTCHQAQPEFNPWNPHGKGES